MLKTLDNSLELLKCFTKQNPSWGVRELSKEINMNHSVVYRILATFESHGFLAQNPETKKYELGIRFLEYGHIVQEKMNLSNYIYPIMKELSEETEESTFLTWLDGSEAVTVEIAETDRRIKFAVSKGARTILYAGASSKVMMAYLPEEKIAEIIDKGLQAFTSKTILEPEKLLIDLEEIRAKGWCYSIGEYSESIFALAVPLFNRKQEIIASLTIGGPEYRMPESIVPEVLPKLQRTAEKIQGYLSQYDLENQNHYIPR
ncbi:IclR family transcriptional regulator [Bacillus sp. AFS002410]|uniref:IclR family transcriptional regulator n=1 Tax=Bacillus sp. AFS002410 TaxID=2033481 RepID=UPI000BF1A26A|nr:IclR family transcriptional regulator [Bacillus sp. AFS002410]PEJ57102.1 IclR family transcriptional regulator [Bacillus sp. AFS002410]